MGQVVTGNPGVDMYILRRGKSSHLGPPGQSREEVSPGRSQEGTEGYRTMWRVLGIRATLSHLLGSA